MELGKKFDVEFKQTIKGTWYVGSLKIGADSVDELDKLMDSTVTFIHAKIDNMNVRMKSRNFMPAGPPSVELNDEEKKLFERLRSIRMELSKTENMPPYMIAHNSVLRRLATAKPMTKEEMIKIDGIGERNFHRYGDYFLNVIRSSCLGGENDR